MTGDTVIFRRHMRLDFLPDGGAEPVFCSEYVSDGAYSFHADTNNPPPTTEELMMRYPLDFIGYIGAWISSFTKSLWNKRYK